MTYPNGGQRDENHPNRKVDKEVFMAKDFPNLPPEALAYLNEEGIDSFNEQYTRPTKGIPGSLPMSGRYGA